MRFVCLGQGKKENLEKFKYIHEAEIDLITLTYDKPFKSDEVNWSSIYLPNSTWSEGRNRLLKEAKKRGCYDYYLFFDDDVIFVKGDIFQLMDAVKNHKPDFAVPLSDSIKYSNRYNPEKEIQKPIAFDQIIQIYSKRAVYDGIAIPYIDRYDSESWWYSCEINQIFTLCFYEKMSLQFNKIETVNSHHATENKEKKSAYVSGLNIERLLEILVNEIKPYKNTTMYDCLNLAIQNRCNIPKDNSTTKFGDIFKYIFSCIRRTKKLIYKSKIS